MKLQGHHNKFSPLEMQAYAVHPRSGAWMVAYQRQRSPRLLHQLAFANHGRVYRAGMGEAPGKEQGKTQRDFDFEQRAWI